MTSQDFVVAIPSYQRAHTLKAKTLKYLQEEGFPKEIIYIFVVEEELEEYKRVLDPDSYGKLVVGVPTIGAQRQFIQSYFPDGQWLFCMDDDVKRVKFLKPMPLLTLVKRMFQITVEENLHIWSIQATNNLYFCQDKVMIGKQMCIGCCFGMINKRFDYPPISSQEDKFRTLTFYKMDGATVRYVGACPDTKYFAKGGLCQYRKTQQKQDAEELVKLFPDECYYKEKRTGPDCDWRTKTFKTRPLL
jgi:hypothetical protein